MSQTAARYLAQGLVAVALLAVFAACDEESEQQPAGEAPERTVAVETVPVERFPHAAGVSAIGSFQAVDRVSVSPEIAGRIVAVHAAEGRMIELGEQGDPPLLFELDDDLAKLRRAEGAARVAVLEAEVAQQAALVTRARQLLQGQAGTEASVTDAELELQRRRAELRQARAELATAEEELARTRIAAPFSGLTGKRRVSVGAYVRPGEELIEIVSLDPIELRFTVPADYAGSVARGQTVRVTVDAYPDEVFDGTVAVVEPAAADVTRSLILLARMGNERHRLRPGMFARVRLALGEPTEVLAVPESAVVTRGEQRYLYVVEDGRARRREVLLGERLPGKVLIAEGLAAGETVIASGLQRVAEGSAVQETAASELAGEQGSEPETDAE